jgi:fumarylacetoacetase
MTNFSLQSWVAVPEGSHFPIQNLPFGIFSTAETPARIGVAIGDMILDLAELDTLGFLKDLDISPEVFRQPFLNDLIALGKAKTNALRNTLKALLEQKSTPSAEISAKILVPKKNATLHLPVRIGDYTDFYSSIEHATNVGTMFRDPANALLPNWKHLPVGYHGRASSIVVSGTPVTRPYGQTKADDQLLPTFQPSRQLDFELEMGFIIGKSTAVGESIATAQAEDYIFGLVLFNDWSARDIQKWEYVPLGPFLAKNFASSMSPWVVPLEALNDFRVETPSQEPAVLPYLQFEGKKNYDIYLEVGIQPQGSSEKIVSQTNFKYMYWNMCQQLAHHTVNGCNVNVGDLCASGTISGPTPDSYGSMLELAWKGTKPLAMSDGSARKFIEDYDTVIMRGYAEKNGVRIGFGEVSGQVLPAKKNT